VHSLRNSEIVPNIRIHLDDDDGWPASCAKEGAKVVEDGKEKGIHRLYHYALTNVHSGERFEVVLHNWVMAKEEGEEEEEEKWWMNKAVFTLIPSSKAVC
jgi:hypothetical protein